MNPKLPPEEGQEVFWLRDGRKLKGTVVKVTENISLFSGIAFGGAPEYVDMGRHYIVQYPSGREFLSEIDTERLHYYEKEIDRKIEVLDKWDTKCHFIEAAISTIGLAVMLGICALSVAPNYAYLRPFMILFVIIIMMILEWDLHTKLCFKIRAWLAPPIDFLKRDALKEGGKK
ncbi:MAG: hypothetical protein WC471_03105 [Candidatus Woesearchaeota archaeon]